MAGYNSNQPQRPRQINGYSGYNQPQQPNPNAYRQQPRQVQQPHPNAYDQSQQPNAYRQMQQPRQPRPIQQSNPSAYEPSRPPRQMQNGYRQPQQSIQPNGYSRPLTPWYEESAPQAVEQKPEKQPKTKVKKGVDYTLWLILLAICVLFIYMIYSTQMFGMKYILAGSGGLGVVVLTFLICIICRKKRNWKRWVSRFSMTALAGVVGFGTYTVYNGMSVLNNMTNSESLMRVSLATLSVADSAPTSIDELAGKFVGYSTSSDRSAVCYAMSKLNESQSDVKFIAYKDYGALYKALESGEVASIIIPNSREATLKSEVENYGDTVSYLTTYTSKRTTKDTVKQDIPVNAKEPFVVYLAGLGEAGDATVDGLTDVNMLAFINPEERSITTISIPRDVYTPNPALNKGSDKLTHLGMDGVHNSMQGLEEMFGIDIDYYARVSFTSIIELVDAIGGVDVDVEIPFTEQDENRSFAYNDLITLDAGEQHLNGKQALAYARHRKGYADGTAGRERAQQKIIKAMVKKICSAEGIANINTVMGVAEKYVATDIPISLIQSIVKQETEDMKPWIVNSLTLEDVAIKSLTCVSMPSSGPLSCQTLSEDNLNLVHTAYDALYGEASMSMDELCKTFEEHHKQTEEARYVVDTSFYETLDQAPDNEYVITTEEVDYIDTNSVVYGLTNTARYEEPDLNTHLRVTIPEISTGYYD